MKRVGVNIEGRVSGDEGTNSESPVDDDDISTESSQEDHVIKRRRDDDEEVADDFIDASDDANDEESDNEYDDYVAGRDEWTDDEYFGDGTGPDGEDDDYDKYVDRIKDYKHEIVENQKTFVSDLTEECLVHIFTYIKKIRKIQLVCKQWAKTIGDNKEKFMGVSTRQLWFYEIDDRKRQQTKIHCKVVNIGHEKELHCKPENFFRKMWSICPFEMTIPPTVNMKLMKQAFDTCPDNYLHNVSKLEFTFNCMSKDDWSWLIHKTPYLSDIEIEIDAYSKRKAPCKEFSLSIAKLLAGTTANMTMLKLDGYNYKSDEVDLIDVLIERSNTISDRPGWKRSSSMKYGGFQYVKINACDVDPDPMDLLYDLRQTPSTAGVPVKKIIKFIEKAHFSKNVCLQLDYSGSLSEMNAWLKKNTRGRFEGDRWMGSYHFKYREKRFDLTLSSA